MKTTIPYRLRVKCNPYNNMSLTDNDCVKLRKSLRAAILDKCRMSMLRVERWRKRGGMKRLEENYWKPPISPLLLLTHDYDKFPDETLKGRIVSFGIPTGGKNEAYNMI